jgi:uncharacterized protein
MLKQRRVPMRMCVGCREMKPKKELLRVVKSPEGVIAFDRVGKAPGRGAYVCKSAECLNKAVKTHALERQLECSVSEEVFSQLSAQLNAEEA